MADTPQTTKLRDMLQAQTELQRRANSVVTVIRNVLVKKPEAHRPTALKPLVSMGHVDTIIGSETGENVTFTRYFWDKVHVTLPIELLTMSDRDVATWTRERINAFRDNTLRTLRRDADREVQAAEGALWKANRRLEQAREEQTRLAARKNAPA